MSIKKMFGGEESKKAHLGRITGSDGHKLKANCLRIKELFQNFSGNFYKKSFDRSFENR